jgi:hypothetical protein
MENCFKNRWFSTSPTKVITGNRDICYLGYIPGDLKTRKRTGTVSIKTTEYLPYNNVLYFDSIFL